MNGHENTTPTLQNEKVGKANPSLQKGVDLFDQYGRLIPGPNHRVYSQVSRRYFQLTQPKINYSDIHSRIQKHLGTESLISAAEFEKTCRELLEKLQQNPSTKNLLNAVHVPFFCTPDTGLDYGKELDEVFLSAVGKSFEENYPEYTFTNYYKGTLEGQVSVVPNCRHEKFLESRKKGVVVGWYFPNCISEYALPDQRALVASLPDSLILSGGIDAAAAFVGSPNLLLRKDDHYPHLLCLSSIAPKEEKFFYHFEAYGWNLTFNRRSIVGAVSEYWAGGLTVIA